MASVGSHIRKSLEDWTQGDLEFAMLHACIAIDGTARIAYPGIPGSNARFTQCLRDNYAVLGPMAMPGINVAETRWPVTVLNPKAPGGGVDLADVIYGIHRCTHGHGEELPNGFELIPNASGDPNYTRIVAQRGTVQLSDRVIFGLLAVAVFSQANIGQRVPDNYFLSHGEMRFQINEWWGRIADAISYFARVATPGVTIDFDSWNNAPTES